MRKILKVSSLVLVFLLLLVGGLLWRDFRVSMRLARERVAGKSSLVTSPYGNIEFSEGGSGPDVLVVHGSGGGFDQGELISLAVLSDEFHWVAPSRFGYLQSTLLPDATLDDQAHAYATLLDHLGIDRVAVIAMSHGGPSALVFAVLYPERVSSLTLLSTGVAASVSSAQAEANDKGSALVKIYEVDALYWAITKFFHTQFLELLGVSRQVSASLTPEQSVWIDRAIDEMNPVSLRTAGVVFDNQVPLPGERIRAIQAPTLIVHAQDDLLQLYHNAEFAAANIHNAQLMSFEHGGHFVLVIEQSKVRAAVQQHILDNWQ